MRRLMLAVLPVVFGCAKGEDAPADSPAAAPAALTEAEVAGTWSGTSTNEAPDTGSVNFTAVCGTGTCKLTVAPLPNDTITSTYTLAADSSHGVSTPYADKLRGGIMVVDHYVVRVSGNTATGHGWVVLADKPDSVISRNRFTATKAP